MKKVDLYVDGGCSGNPGPGGWAYILVHKGSEKEHSGYVADTTNNRMELQAVIEGLKGLKEPCRVTIHTDSGYIYNAFMDNWIGAWQSQGWTRGKKRLPVLNVDLWQELIENMKPHKVNWEKVKGHSGHEYNERTDKLAVKAYRDKMKKKVKKEK